MQVRRAVATNRRLGETPPLDLQIRSLLPQLSQESLRQAGIIPWSSPVPVFGSIDDSEVATVGLNPSNREFVDAHGNELEGAARRFHTLRSLCLERWADADAWAVTSCAGCGA